MAGRRAQSGPVAVEAPRVAAVLEPLDGGTIEDGDVIEAVHWTEAGVPEGLRDVEIAESRLSGVRLTGLELDDVTIIDTEITGCELSGIVASGLRCERVTFTDCRMSGLVASELRARHVRFSNCQLDGAWLRAAGFELCELVDCDLGAADLTGARFTSSRLVRCRLDGADLADVEAEELALHGSTVEGTKGLEALWRLVIGSDQIVALALPLLAARGIRVDDDYLDALDGA